MISWSESLPIALQRICEYDESIKFDPIRIVGFLNDVYQGRRDVLDDFLEALTIVSLHSSIHTLSDVSYPIPGIHLTGANSKDRSMVQSALLQFVYRNDGSLSANQLDKLIHKTYGRSFTTTYKPIDKSRSPSIAFFNVSPPGMIEYGKIITLSWKCNNPHKVYLNNGVEQMDVTGINSVKISAMSDKYILSLHNLSGFKIDQKEIIITYREKAFCVICGAPYMPEDKFCSRCGINLQYDSKN